MRILVLATVLALLFGGSVAQAEDGLVVQFRISEHSADSSNRTSINSAVLMAFNEEVSFGIGGQYELKIESRKNGDERVSLLVSLKDIIDGKPYYVGARPADIKVGEQAELTLERFETNYTITLDTSYGKLPET